MLAKQTKRREYLGRAGKPWTEQEKQEVKAAHLRKESIGGIAAVQERHGAAPSGRAAETPLVCRLGDQGKAGSDFKPVRNGLMIR